MQILSEEGSEKRIITTTPWLVAAPLGTSVRALRKGCFFCQKHTILWHIMLKPQQSPVKSSSSSWWWLLLTLANRNHVCSWNCLL